MVEKQFIGTYCWYDLRNYTKYILKSNIKECLKLVDNYYYVIQENIDIFDGQVASMLGDGVGVLFEGKNQIERSVECSKKICKNMLQKGFQVGVGIDKGKIIQGESFKASNILDKFYIGSVVLKTYRISCLHSAYNKSVFISKNIYDQLSKSQKELFYKYQTLGLKGFKGKHNIYSLKKEISI